MSVDKAQPQYLRIVRSGQLKYRFIKLTFGGVGGCGERGKSGDVGERPFPGFVRGADSEMKVRPFSKFPDLTDINGGYDPETSKELFLKLS